MFSVGLSICFYPDLIKILKLSIIIGINISVYLCKIFVKFRIFWECMLACDNIVGL